MIDPADLLDATEVAAVLGLAHRQAVSTYRGRYDDFPAPVVTKSRCLLWLRADIEAWAARR
jgi:predicted DNA-binding transcriptional regulator AlpA